MKRNILLITADHMRHDALPCNTPWASDSALAHIVQAPNLDRLAEEGITFGNSFSVNPVCVPARATITTGKYPHKCGDGYQITPDQPKLAEIFNENGYATYAIGKLHYLPYFPPDQPRLLHGFQYAELNEEGRLLAQFDPSGETEGIEDYHDYLKSVGWGGYQRAHGIGNNDARATTSPVPAEHHKEAWTASRTIAALEKHLAEKPDQPFLMWSSFAKPHPPYDPPPPFDKMYDPRQIPEPLGGWDNEDILQGRDPELIRRRKQYGWDKLSPQAVQLSRARYCGLVSFQDEMIGRILDWLGRHGLADNTIIVYTCDHGDLLGDFGRFFKCCMYDGSVRIPMIWRVPGVTGADSTHRREQLVGSQDVLPTLCSLAGVDLADEIDGMDLTPVIKDPDAPGREFYVSYTHTNGTWKAMLRTSNWKYAYCELGGVEELYNALDPDGELRNLANDPTYANIVKEMRAQLIQWCIDNDWPVLQDGDLKSTPIDSLDPVEFNPSRLGWRRL